MTFITQDRISRVHNLSRLHPISAWAPNRFGRRHRAAIAIAGAALVSAIGVKSPIAAAVIVYVLGFTAVAAYYPAAALTLIFAAAPFQNDLSGGGSAKFSIAEINLVLTLPVLYMRSLQDRRRIHVGPILVPVLLYFAICIVSSSIHWLGVTTLISLVQMFLYFVVAVAVFSSLPSHTRQYLPGLNAIVWIGVFLAIAGIATDYWFIGLNKNGIAASLACSFLVGVELSLSTDSRLKRRLLLLALIIIGAGLLYSLSRGAWLGTLAGVVYMFRLRREMGRLFRILLLLLPILLVFWFTLPQSSREYATGFSESHYNIKLRYQSIDLARKYFDESPIYGMGVGLRKDYDATNIILMTLAETGVLGAFALMMIHVAFFRSIARTRARLYRGDPMLTYLCIGGALVLDKLIHGMVDHYWSRGAIMAAWAAAGMAARVYYITRSKPLAPPIGRDH